MRRITVLAVLTAGLLLALSGVALADAEVTIGDDGFEPESVEADVREPIVWTNTTDEPVSLVGEEPSWESGPIEPGATFSIEITQPGTYSYGTEDGALSGEIVVAQAGEDDDADENGNGEGNGEDETEEPEVDEQVQPDDDEGDLPHTGGLDSVVPAVLSVLLIAFGFGLLVLTQPRRRLGA
ncbi:MAG TPA: hypothetical protein VM307_07230 [Egibacteraceae bacterium]|nr:hypothetical protein [Egibacteraceae bacterium]